MVGGMDAILSLSQEGQNPTLFGSGYFQNL